MVEGGAPGPEQDRDWGAAAVEDELEEWQSTELDRSFASLAFDHYLLMRPSDEQEVVNGLPEAQRGDKWIAFRPGEIVLTDGDRQVACGAGGGWGKAGTPLPRAKRLVLVTFQTRARWRGSSQRRYLVAAGEDDELLAWIDHSPPSWDFRPGQITQIARMMDLDSAVERYQSEDELSAAHPGWLG